MTFPSQINSIAALPFHSGEKGFCRVSWRVCRWQGRVDMINLVTDCLCCGGCLAWGVSHLLNLGSYFCDNTSLNAFPSFCSGRDPWGSVSHLAMHKIMGFQDGSASSGKSWPLSHLSHSIKIILAHEYLDSNILTTQVNITDCKTSWLLAMNLMEHNNLKGVHCCKFWRKFWMPLCFISWSVVLI